MIDASLILTIEYAFIIYFLMFHLSYLMLTISAFMHLPAYIKLHSMEQLIPTDAQMIPPISILVPAYNEEHNICSSIHALLQLKFPEYEILVINDGSKDRTLQNLIKEFDLIEFPEAYRVRLATQPIGKIYKSTRHHNLRVIDKKNGGKADSLNAGLNAAQYPLFCGVDADSVLERDSLERVIRSFIENPNNVASGGTIRISNGCEVEQGHLIKSGLPRNLLALFQVAEYLRAFLFGRLGWSPINALLIISGAFGVFKKEVVISVGGYMTNTVGEDMELIVRIHRILRKQKTPYNISFVPDPVCWTEAPEDLKTLKNQRVRWQRGLSESLSRNMSLLFSRSGGTAGWLAFPFFIFFEWIGPLIEVSGYAFSFITYALGYLNTQAFFLFLTVSLGFGAMLSITAVLLDEISFLSYPKPKDLVILFLIAIIENLGYRQLNTIWRLIGFTQWLSGKQGQWGVMKRTGKWKKN